MKKFSDKTKDKLLAIGCKPSSQGYIMYPIPREGKIKTTDVSYFTIADFLSDEEYAKENCKKVWGFRCPDEALGKECPTDDGNRPHHWVWQQARIALLETENQEAFILAALEKVNDPT